MPDAARVLEHGAIPLGRTRVRPALPNLSWWITGTAIWLLGMALRWMTLTQYTGHIDEPSSLLAVQRVAERGYPLFPSGVLYLQGAVFSYLAAPLTWRFSGDELLDAARALQVVLTSLAIPLVMRLVYDIGTSRLTALLAGLLVACDPSLIIWGVAIRPYGLLAFIVLAQLILFARLVDQGPDARFASVRIVWWMPVIATLGTFTHIGFWVVIPPLALAALLIWRGRLRSTHRAIVMSGLGSLAPLILFLVLGRFAGTGSGTSSGDMGSAFMGSHIFDLPNPLRMEEHEWELWTGNFVEGSLHPFMPLLLLLVTGILLGAVLAPAPAARPVKVPMTATLLLVHWASIGLVILLSAPSAGTRYLLHALPLGHALLSLSALVVWRLATAHDRSLRVLLRAGMTAVIVVPALVYVVTGARWRIDAPGGNPGYWDATAWLSKRIVPGEALMTAMPPPVYFWVDGDRHPLYFLAGPAGSERAAQYTKHDENGRLIDYWLGIDPITSDSSLCSALERHAGAAWIMVDQARFDNPDMLGPGMEEIILGATEIRHRGANGVLVLWVTAPSAWSAETSAICTN